MQPLDAIAWLRSLQRRVELATAHLKRPSPWGSWAPPASSTVEWASSVAGGLAAADRHLRRFLGDHDGDEQSTPPPLNISDPTAEGAPTVVRLIAIADTAERLIEAIRGATTEDWYRRSRYEGVSPAELVWVALQQADRDLEDLELAVRRAPPPSSATSPPLAGL
jgi:hypothetical protein